MDLRFNIVQGVYKPIIRNNKIKILFDMGASTPVWCVGKKRFYRIFPEAAKQDFKYILTGFGRTEQELKKFLKYPSKDEAYKFLADVYDIPSFCLGVGEQIFTWKNLKVAVTEKEGIGAELILPSTMFRGMEVRWNQEDVGKPYIEIRSQTAVKYVFVQKYPEEFFSEKLLKYIYSQDSLELENINVF